MNDHEGLGPPYLKQKERIKSPHFAHVGDALGRCLPTSRKWWAIYLGIWMVPVVVLSTQRYVVWQEVNSELTFFDEFFYQLTFWYLHALLAPIVMWFGRHFPIHHEKWQWSVLAHLVLAIPFVVVRTLLFTPLIMVSGGYIGKENTFEFVSYIYFWKNYTFDWFMYFACLGGGWAIDYYRAFQDRERRTAQLEVQLAQAQLNALKMQIHPHFLFNTLNAIAALVRTGRNKGAVKMIVGLSELLRIALDSEATQIIPLSQELGFLERYLTIEQVRFPDRLRVQKQVDAGTLDAMVPNLILQPLVENAICHGIGPRSTPGTVEIRAQRSGQKIILEIWNDGAPLPDDWSQSACTGVGLRNTQARLERLYQGEQTFLVHNAPGGGVVARITLPYMPNGEEIHHAN